METEADLAALNHALRLAAADGRAIDVLTKLSEGADVNSKGRPDTDKYGNALQAASANGHNQVVRILLRARADVDIGGGKYGYPLVAASNKGHLEIVQLLIDSKASIWACHPWYGSALHTALKRDHVDIVRFLLKKGAVPDRSAIEIAAAAGDHYAVRLLLKEARDLRTFAIECAAEHGNHNIVRSLLRKIGRTEAEMKWYGAALVAASTNGQDNMVALLLGRGSHLSHEAKNEWYRDALAQALGEGHLGVISQFFKHNDLICSLKGASLHSLRRDRIPALSLLLRINGWCGCTET
jgi:ankyrin repeat protein